MTTHVKLTPSGDSSTGPVLLKSAGGILKTDRGNITANILFDEGAQRTFITEDTVKRLNIANHHCRKETVSLSAFGENTANLRRLNVVDLQLEARKGVINLSALVVPTVSSLVTNHVHAVVAKYPYLKNLPLANHVQSSSFEIDLLVGADYYKQGRSEASNFGGVLGGLIYRLCQSIPTNIPEADPEPPPPAHPQILHGSATE